MSGLLERLGLFVRVPDMRPRAEIEADIREELAAHVALRARDNEAAGMPPEAALRDAELRFGDTRRVFAECRDVQMKERIMLQRINAVLIVVLLLGVVANLWAGADARAGMERNVAALRSDVGALTGLVREVRTEAQAAAAIDVGVPKFRMPAGVLPVEESRRVHVLGSVASPGAVTYRKGLTLSMAIAECGGFGQHADASRISIVHERGKIDVVDMSVLRTGTKDLADLYAGHVGKPDPERIDDPELKPGDRVIVPESFF